MLPAICKNKRKFVIPFTKKTIKFQYSQTLPQHSRLSISWWFWFGITRSWGSARPLPPPPRFVAAARKVVEEEEPGEPEVRWNLYRLRSYIKIYKTCKKSDIYHMNWWRISSIKSMFAIYYAFVDSLVISHMISSSSRVAIVRSEGISNLSALILMIFSLSHFSDLSWSWCRVVALVAVMVVAFTALTIVQ